MSYETIKYELEDNILTITLNRPDRLNAFTGQMMDELISAFDKAGKDDDVRVVIVTGEGRGRKCIASCRAINTRKTVLTI